MNSDTITVTRQQLIETTRIMAGAVTSLMVGNYRVDAVERLAADVFDGIKAVPFAPSPPTETAMAAAKEPNLIALVDAAILAFEKSGRSRIDFHCQRGELRDVIVAHFQPLLAKVEGERDAAVKDRIHLRADLAAKGEAQPHEEIIALADATLAHLNPDCQAAVSIRYARDLVKLKRLAARADKGEDTARLKLIVELVGLGMQADVRGHKYSQWKFRLGYGSRDLIQCLDAALAARASGKWESP